MSENHPSEPPIKKIYGHIARCLTQDRFRFNQRIQKIIKDPHLQGLAALEEEIAKSMAAYQMRVCRCPAIHLQTELPIVAKQHEIIAALQANQVIVVTGETGSGKTTQLPQIALAMGRGIAGMIGHTQPRRIAARSVAARIADELKVTLGQQVGYKVRFSDHAHEEGYIKVMTDGILLAELQQDRYLSRYDTLIIDEAHERSLNIDFILGYLKWLLPKRPDLKIIITSATIDPQRFSKHFNNVPIIEVSGRTYPVDVWYRPPLEDAAAVEDAWLTAIISSIQEVSSLGQGDTLVFLTGEREIREVAAALHKQKLPQREILPLYSRLSLQEQNKIFQATARQRIILATNVAETSLTVPGIRYVIDTGYARISRYSYRTKVQRLPIEKISRASCDQRKGRAGRTAPGICVRLYSEIDYAARPLYTDAEILRTNLAAVILQMHLLKLGDITTFPFIDKPDSRRISDGLKLLTELGALDDKNVLTPLGSRLAQLPLEPRLARMVLAASTQGALREVLIIASGLSIADPCERPADKAALATQKHRAYWHEHSDFVGLVHLWQAFEAASKQLSQNKLRHYCQENFLSFMRMREWREIYQQLVGVVTELGFRLNEVKADYAAIHQSLLAGLLGHIACKQEKGEYLGARGNKLAIFPGSSLYKKQPEWGMAASLVETEKLYMHRVAKIDPAWIIPAASHLVTRQYFEPHWEKKRAEVVAWRRTSLYGLVIEPRKKVSYSAIDGPLCREIFIREGLVAGDYQTKAEFFQHNQQLVESIAALEDRVRRRDILVDEAEIYAFYDRLLPADIVNGFLFEKWRKEIEKTTPNILFLTPEKLTAENASTHIIEEFPDKIKIGSHILSLSYHFEPGHPQDGVTITLPQALFKQLPLASFEWLVSGLLREKVIALIKTLPKSLRRNFVPVPHFADAFLSDVTQAGSLLTVLSKKLTQMAGVVVTEADWELSKIPAHLLMNFRLLNLTGEEIAMGREVKALLAGGTTEVVHVPSTSLATDQTYTAWNFGDLTEYTEQLLEGVKVKVYPALVDQNTYVTIQYLTDENVAKQLVRAGIRRLFLLSISTEIKYLRKNIPDLKQMSLHFMSVGDAETLTQDLIEAIADKALFADADLIYRQADFIARQAAARPRLAPLATELSRWVRAILANFHEISARLSTLKTVHPIVYQDMSQQLAALVYPGFVLATPYDTLKRLPVYLKAMLLRLEKLAAFPKKDEALLATITPLVKKYNVFKATHSAVNNAALITYRWLLEEYRISLFAQSLKTTVPVSAKRLEMAWQAVVKGGANEVL